MNFLKKLFKPAETVRIELKPTQPIPTLGPKRCTRCKESKNREEFNKCQRTPDGLQYWCKNCQKLGYKRTAKVKRRGGPVAIPQSNFEKKTLQLNIPDVSQAQYRQLVELAKARKWPMERLYRQMVTDFLTLHTK